MSTCLYSDYFTKTAFQFYLEGYDAELKFLRDQYAEDDIKAIAIHSSFDPASEIYLRNKKKIAEKFGIELKIFDIKATSQEEFIKKVQNIKSDYIVPIIIQFPLPWHIPMDKFKIWNRDIDGLSSGSIVDPCTPAGIMKHLQWAMEMEHKDISDLNILIINRSELVGNPLARLARNLDMNVMQIHSKTSLKNKYRLFELADVIVTATGKQNFISLKDLPHIRRDAIIYDVGITRTKEGKVTGDCSNEIKNIRTISPVPGGVGLLTLREFIYNILTIHSYIRNNII